MDQTFWGLCPRTVTSSEALYLYAEKLLSPKLLTSFYPNLQILAMLLSRTLCQQSQENSKKREKE